ncbi:MAG: phosphate signaling complex protein PhoU [Pirellulales bacterium]|jgi:phosphate transport system protein
MKKFDQELAALKGRIVEMGDLAQSMIDLAVKALLDRKAEISQELLAKEDRLDRLQLDVDNEVVRLLTVYSPVAVHLRFILMVSRINAELERIGDQAVNLCEYVDLLRSHGGEAALLELPKMAKIVRGMIGDAMQAFCQDDSKKAEEILATDNLVDTLNDQVVRDLLASPPDVTTALALILVGRSLERVGDQASNIGAEVIYIVKGADIRHSAVAHGNASSGGPTDSRPR